MSNDYDKIKNMEYDLNRKRYVGKNGSELRITPYSDGSGYKYDYYNKSPYGNAKHNSTHISSDLNGNWSRVDNDRDKGIQNRSSGSGCYLTTSCMVYQQKKFNDNCKELMILRWFRDNFVSNEDVMYYYSVAPKIVEKIDSSLNKDKIYNYIYEYIVQPCVDAILKTRYDFAYIRYKNSVLVLEKMFLEPLNEESILLRKIKK